MITTSREPTPAMRTLAKDLHKVIPNSLHITRGKMNIEKLAETMLELGALKLLLITRWEGNPGKIEFYQIQNSKLKLIPPILHLRRVFLRREFKREKDRARGLRLAIAASQNIEHQKLATALSEIFNIPFKTRSIKNFHVTLKIVEDKIGRTKITFHNGEYNEVGPAIYLNKIQWDTE